MIYADNAAQHPPFAEAVEAAAAAAVAYGNPSGVHGRSSAAARLLFGARVRVAAALGAQPAQVIFTASGTEADNLAVFSAAVRGKRRKLIIFAAEHKAVLNAALSAERYLGSRVEYLPSLPDGTADLAALGRMLDGDTALVALMHANNETGVLQPVSQAAQMAHAAGALLHTDAVQTAGHVPLDVCSLGCDTLSISAHKFGGIPGAGALWCRSNLPVAPLITGGRQERGVRAGTEALPAICAMGTALELAAARLDGSVKYVTELRDGLMRGLADIGGVVFPGAESARVPGILCACFPGHDGERTALLLDRAGICVSSGAACTTGDPGASHVLAAMGVPAELARCAVRFSLGEGNTAAETETIAETVRKIMKTDEE